MVAGDKVFCVYKEASVVRLFGANAGNIIVQGVLRVIDEKLFHLRGERRHRQEPQTRS